MKQDVNWYEILEITSQASLQEVKNAYQKLKNVFSSDQQDNLAFYSIMSSEEKMKCLEQIEAAYAVLSQPEARRAYDALYFYTNTEVTEERTQKSTVNLVSSSSWVNFEPAQKQFQKNRFPELSAELFRAIQLETDWKGSFLKKIREAYHISIEEMGEITRVTKSYLLAIEEEDYAKLPAAVYVRGFVVQIAKVLKLPHEQVATAYVKSLKSHR